MSVFEPFANKPQLEGIIQINHSGNFAYFAMELSNVHEVFGELMKEINNTLQEKQELANISFCSFKNHDGEIDHFRQYLLNLICFKALTYQYG